MLIALLYMCKQVLSYLPWGGELSCNTELKHQLFKAHPIFQHSLVFILHHLLWKGLRNVMHPAPTVLYHSILSLQHCVGACASELSVWPASFWLTVLRTAAHWTPSPLCCHRSSRCVSQECTELHPNSDDTTTDDYHGGPRS